jgi:hypothetical protein
MPRIKLVHYYLGACSYDFASACEEGVATATRMCMHKLIVRVVLERVHYCDTVTLSSAVDLFGLFKGWGYRRDFVCSFP